MNNSSGFRTIEFIEKDCNYVRISYDFDSIRCIKGLLWTFKDLPITSKCPDCKGASKIEVTESKLE